MENMNERAKRDFENEHSKRLRNLLDEHVGCDYHILKSFIEYFIDDRLVISQPEITFNEEYIDIWIKDTNYAIIIENKVNGAPDRYKQIENYINKTKDTDYNLSQIYVIYLAKDENDRPENEALGKYEEHLGNRFKIVPNVCKENSNKKNLLSWLKSIKGIVLSSHRQQELQTEIDLLEKHLNESQDAMGIRVPNFMSPILGAGLK